MRRVVPLIWAGALRASSMVRIEPPATPVPATVRNFRRLRVAEPLSVGRSSLIVSLLCGHGAGREITTRSERVRLFMLRGRQLSSTSARLGSMRRPALAMIVILLGLGVFVGGLAWLLDTPKPPPGMPRIARLYLGLCATCHGEHGRGSCRAALFLIRPGNLADPARLAQHSDQYLFDIIKNGGAPIGRPGMPAFGGSLSDDDIRALVAY